MKASRPQCPWGLGVRVPRLPPRSIISEMKDEFQKMLQDPRGWITDKGVCFWSPMYKHVEDLSEKVEGEEEYYWVAEECQAWMEKKADQEQVPAQLAEEGEHPAWHAYEIWLMDAEPEFRKKFMNMLYRKGWVRVGNGPGILSFEGSREGLSRNKSVIDDIVECTNFEEVDQREIEV